MVELEARPALHDLKHGLLLLLRLKQEGRHPVRPDPLGRVERANDRQLLGQQLQDVRGV